VTKTTKEQEDKIEKLSKRLKFWKDETHLYIQDQGESNAFPGSIDMQTTYYGSGRGQEEEEKGRPVTRQSSGGLGQSRHALLRKNADIRNTVGSIQEGTPRWNQPPVYG